MQISRWPTCLQSWHWAIPLTALVTAVVATIPTLAFAGHETANVADYSGCLTSGGNISNVAAGTTPKLPCSPNQTQVHFSGGDITQVTTPSSGGLQGGTTNGAASLELQQTYRLPQACSAGEVAKWNASSWACATDTNTTYDGTDFALSDQSCAAGKFVTGISASGEIVCDGPAAPKLSVITVDDSAHVPFFGGAVAAATCPDGYRLVGGGWGVAFAIEDGADVFDYVGGPDTYDVGAGSGNPGGGDVFARAYCIRVS